MARKYVRAIKQSYYAGQGMMNFNNEGDIEYNYDNAGVMVIPYFNHSNRTFANNWETLIMARAHCH